MMSDAQLRQRCANLALSGMSEAGAGSWTLSEASVARIEVELANAGPLVSRMLATLGTFAMWIPSYRSGSEAARDALLRLIARWQTKLAATSSPAGEALSRFSQRAAPPRDSHRAMPGIQFAIADNRKKAPALSERGAAYQYALRLVDLFVAGIGATLKAAWTRA